jgi:hypothetical protein
MKQCQVRVFHNFVPSFGPNEWCLKNSLHSGVLNPGPLGHESSALTTRPRLLANQINNLWVLVSVTGVRKMLGNAQKQFVLVGFD